MGKQMVEDKSIAERMKRIGALVPKAERHPKNDGFAGPFEDVSGSRMQQEALNEICCLARTVLQDTVGERHALWKAFEIDEKWTNPAIVLSACKTLQLLFENGALGNRTLRIAQEIDGEILAVAEAQAKAAESTADSSARQMRLAVASFLAGAALEDALRRLCDKNNVRYDTEKTTLAKLQTALYCPSKGADFISLSDNKAITSWGETRNNADHGHFEKLRPVEVATMVAGVRDFIARALV